MHAQKNRSKLRQCDNIQIKGPTLEDKVFRLIEENILDYTKLKDHMPFFKRGAQRTQLKFERQLNAVEQQTKKMQEAKKRILDLYSKSEIEREAYVNKSLEYDNELNKLKIRRVDLIKQIPLLHKKELIATSIEQYSELVRIQFGKCLDFESKRQFLLDHVDKIVYETDSLEFHGYVPVQLKVYEDKQHKTELTKVPFCIKDTIDRRERFGRHDRKPNFDVQITRKEFNLIEKS